MSGFSGNQTVPSQNADRILRWHFPSHRSVCSCLFGSLNKGLRDSPPSDRWPEPAGERHLRSKQSSSGQRDSEEARRKADKPAGRLFSGVLRVGEKGKLTMETEPPSPFPPGLNRKESEE